MLRKVERIPVDKLPGVETNGFPGCLLTHGGIRVEGWPNCAIPSTWYVSRDGVLIQMLSVAPSAGEDEGIVRYGWDMCGGCGQHITVCPCKAGPKPIEIIRRWLQLDQEKTQQVQTVVDPELRRRVEAAQVAASRPAEERPVDLASLDREAVGESSSVLKKLKKRLS